ncbi:MAG: bifunctional hydroxymethylpyrimidine kinase/phosphomethylpyrimidine kinase [Duodenibacillus sp.]|nr:bifunctional hydroxymethylpyrimidine kinase/phosphomethylpyrimidine kinase [Duodenibacillus sp.]
MTESIANALTIAGVDPSGGAGVLADVKAMSACGVYATAVVTALTAQNTQGVAGIHPVPPDFVRQQLEVLFDDVRVDAVKVGMLASCDIIRAVADVLGRRHGGPVVVDPVMVATSGDRLLPEASCQVLIRTLLPIATLITPNLQEASCMLGRDIASLESMTAAAHDLRRLAGGRASVYLKGGHLTEGAAADYLLMAGQAEGQWFVTPRVSTKNSHGTGCTLSAAIAARLARGDPMEQAVAAAKSYIANALAHADELSVGRGHGPVHHFTGFWGN